MMTFKDFFNQNMEIVQKVVNNEWMEVDIDNEGIIVDNQVRKVYFDAIIGFHAEIKILEDEVDIIVSSEDDLNEYITRYGVNFSNMQEIVTVFKELYEKSEDAEEFIYRLKDYFLEDNIWIY